MYRDEELLMLSGIQHFYFCKRQWALIHIEQQWSENGATMEGKFIHENADDPFFMESRKNTFISRAVPLVSYNLGFIGVADIIEFKKSSKGVVLKGKEGLWIPNVVEYKRGKPKEDRRDIVQLVLEVICLEEMLECSISSSDFYYNETRRRVKVEITSELREEVIMLGQEMHSIYDKKLTPPAIKGKICRNCSLVDICIPRMTNKKVNVSNYIERYLKEEGENI